MNEVIILGGIDAGDRLYLSIPGGHEDDAIALLPELDGKRNIPEEVVKEEPPEKTITLPDGRVIKVDGSKRGQRPGGRKSGDKVKLEEVPKKKPD